MVVFDGEVAQQRETLLFAHAVAHRPQDYFDASILRDRDFDIVGLAGEDAQRLEALL